MGTFLNVLNISVRLRQSAIAAAAIYKFSYALGFVEALFTYLFIIT